MLDLGMPTLLEMPGALECAMQCGTLGLQFVELNMNLPEYQIGRIDERPLFAARERYPVYFTLHLDENFNICDFNPLVCEAYTQTALSAIELAKRLEMPVINMHLHEGVHFMLPDGKTYLFERYMDEYLASLKKFRDLCGDAVAGSGILLCVENCGGFQSFSRQGISLLLESEAFALTLDVGHSHCAGNIDMPFYTQNAACVRHFHLHDANAETCHLPFGTVFSE